MFPSSRFFYDRRDVLTQTFDMAAVIQEPKTADREADVEKGGPTAVAQEEEPKEEETQYPGWRKLTLILMSLYLAMFIVALVSRPKELDAFHTDSNRTEQ